MDIATIERRLSRINPRLLEFAMKILKKIPYFRRMIKGIVRKESAAIMGGLEDSLKPYRGSFPDYAELPEKGRPRNEIIAMMQRIKAKEEPKWKKGFVSGAVYHGDAAHIEFHGLLYAGCEFPALLDLIQIVWSRFPWDEFLVLPASVALRADHRPVVERAAFHHLHRGFTSRHPQR